MFDVHQHVSCTRAEYVGLCHFRRQLLPRPAHCVLFLISFPVRYFLLCIEILIPVLFVPYFVFYFISVILAIYSGYITCEKAGVVSYIDSVCACARACMCVCV